MLTPIPFVRISSTTSAGLDAETVSADALLKLAAETRSEAIIARSVFMTIQDSLVFEDVALWKGSAAEDSPKDASISASAEKYRRK